MSLPIASYEKVSHSEREVIARIKMPLLSRLLSVSVSLLDSTQVNFRTGFQTGIFFLKSRFGHWRNIGYVRPQSRCSNFFSVIGAISIPSPCLMGKAFLRLFSICSATARTASVDLRPMTTSKHGKKEEEEGEEEEEEAADAEAWLFPCNYLK